MLRLPCLDARLQAAFDLIGVCSAHADIGADHGLLPLRLITDKKAARVIVSDISAASLAKAISVFERFGCTEHAEFVEADGIDAITEPVDSLSILGMGGDRILGILKRGAAVLKGAALILSPHTRLYETRRGLYEMGYHIAAEKLVLSRGRYYVLMRAETGSEACDERALRMGPCFIKEPPPHYEDYLSRQGRYDKFKE